jgi:DNA-binding response OmpR family regulator
MNELLLVEATEELQPLAEALARAGFRVGAASPAEAAALLSRGERRFDALLLNLTGGLAGAAELLRAPARPAAIALVRPAQLADLPADLPVDDFAVFPCPPEELAARVRRALARRSEGDDAQVLRCGDVTIDQASYKVYVGSRAVDLTYKEYELLRFLAQNPDKVCTRETLLNRVWGYDFYGGARTVDVHIRRLRSKIEDPAHALIETVRNVGYRLRSG